MSKCSVVGCEAVVWQRGLCTKHYKRLQRHGDVNTVLIGNRTCSICGHRHYSRDLCYKHYMRWMRHGDPNYNKTEAAQRFVTDTAFQHQKKRECLIWPFHAMRAGKGYATVRWNGERQYVHRLVCEHINGPAPSPNHDALHRCGNGHKGCVNPHHLYWGTPTNNAADMLRDGRGANQFGEFVSFPMICSVNSCNRPHYAKGLCTMHYQQQRRD